MDRRLRPAPAHLLRTGRTPRRPRRRTRRSGRPSPAATRYPTAVDPDDLLLTVAGDSLRELTTVDQLAAALASRGVTLPTTLRPLLARDQALVDPPPVRPGLSRSDVEQAAQRAAGARRRTTSAAARPAALWSRAGNDLLPAFADAVDAALSDLPDVDAVPDCELVVLDDTARPDFAALSDRAGSRSATAVRRAAAAAPALLLAFDERTRPGGRRRQAPALPLPRPALGQVNQGQARARAGPHPIARMDLAPRRLTTSELVEQSAGEQCGGSRDQPGLCRRQRLRLAGRPRSPVPGPGVVAQAVDRDA
jgi:hypothetical protein